MSSSEPPALPNTNGNGGHLFLIGYRGSGKSTVGPLVARRLQFPWLDSDDRIQQQQGCSIAEIFARGGESEFRRLESRVLNEITNTGNPPSVLSLGGGAILAETNRRLMSERGWTVWLTAPAEILMERIAGDQRSGDQRPNLTATGGMSEVIDVLRQREPLYRAAADAEVSVVGKSAEAVAEEIEALWRGRGA